MPEVKGSDWDDFLGRHPDAHLLQTSAWGELKSGFGWDVARVVVPGERLGAQVLFRGLPLGLTLAYIPKGPVGELETEGGWRSLWQEIDSLCRRRKAVFLKVEPDQRESCAPVFGAKRQGSGAPPPGFRDSEQAIQPARTLLVDLRGDEQQVLMRMKQKTRYNVRLALKKGVVVRPSADLDTFYRLMIMTGERDAFGVHSLGYYRRAYDLFHPQGACELLVAEYQGEPLAALMAFARGERAWYFYGASASEHRERMPTYLIQWEAMRWARARGCDWYDLWGVPDYDEETLEANFTQRKDGLWGVYRFKRGFGGQLHRDAGPWDRVYQPVLYTFYHLWARYRTQEL